MINGKKILAVVPARGGSNGIKLKNLRKINKISLVSHVGNTIKKIKIIDKAILSTDNKKIAKVAIESGLTVPFIRPKGISGDKVSDYKVIIHALKFAEKKDKVKYDIVVSLPPTSPLRKSKDVIGAIKLLIDKKYDAVWTVSKTDSKYHPLKQLSITKNKLKYYNPKGAKIIARQQLDKVYHRNGVAYVISRNCLVNLKSILSRNSGAYVVKGNQISIDTLSDIKFANSLF